VVVDYTEEGNSYAVEVVEGEEDTGNTLFDSVVSYSDYLLAY